MADQKKNTVLVVDDTPTNIDILVNALSIEYEVSVATDGESALEMVQSDLPDLVLLDIMMPGMDGYEVCRRLKSNEATKDVPVIFITAKGETKDEREGFELGGVDYIIKPFSVEIVKARVSIHLELKYSRDVIKKYNEQLETMLEKRTKELVKSERQAAFGQLVQGIVHNMRSPLTVIAGSFSTQKKRLKEIGKLEDDMSEDAKSELNETMSVIMRSNERGSKSTNRLEEMLKSMMSRGRRDNSSVIEIEDINDIIRQELEFMNADLDFKHKTKKIVDLDDKQIHIEVVPAEIAQLIQNLFRNALDAMHLKEEKKLEIISRVENSDAVLRISDNGFGMSGEVQERIFDPFFTTKPKANDEKRGNKPTGTGLGLWMCKETIENYGGSITVKSEVGTGTVFTIRLPLKR